ncbi:M48 family metalloprotease [Streptosporangium canum]|uniref:M48 family metalloprotease n=1 Tax=Streptosporangium canum TaxID=324952 RepID=UPI00342EE7E1
MTQPERVPAVQGTLAVFDPAAVRISYNSPAPTVEGTAGDAVPTADQARVIDGELPGLAALVWALRSAAELPGVAVIVDPALGDNAAAADCGRCARVPVLELGADLLQARRRLALCGTLAHEIAHLALGHPGQGSAAEWQHTARVAAIGALLVLVFDRPWAAVGLTVVAAALHLLGTRVRRLAEYDADSYAVTLLERAGMPGAQTVTAMLADVADDEPRWYTLAGWAVGEHPTAAARLRTIGTGLCAPRLDWRSAWRCTATGLRLGSHAHRRAHGPGQRCRPTWWRLIPLWRPPVQR